MTEDVQLVHIRIPKPLLKRLDHYAVDRNLYRAEALAEILRMQLDAKDDADCEHCPGPEEQPCCICKKIHQKGNPA